MAPGGPKVDLVPRIGPDLLAPQADTLGVFVELQDLDLDFLANLNHLRWVGDAAVGHVRDVEESVDAAEVDERTVVGDVLDHAIHDCADLETTDGLLALRLTLLREEDAAREHDVAALLVELDDLELVGLADDLLEVLDRAKVHLGARKECLHTNVYGEAALHA